ncbi:hypothetical protein KW791_00545 [Candidatus Parcubacteria bacterium]|nr:hypothetical protein [Candidatus Parcubacteria bacterium]
MADGFSELSSDKLQTVQGISELNRMLQFLYENVAGDGVKQRVYSGIGSPEGSVVAEIGSFYMRLDGAPGTCAYIKESGVQTATGWTSIVVAGGGSGGSGNAQYVTLATDASLTAERVLTEGANISLTDAGANSTITIKATPAGSDTQIQFNDDGTFGGDSDLTWDKTANIFKINGDINFSETTDADKTIKVLDQATANTNGNRLFITGSDGNGSADGGDLIVSGGDGGVLGGDGGYISFSAGNATGAGRGGEFIVYAGGGGETGDGGTAYLVGGDGGSTSGDAGGVGLTAGNVFVDADGYGGDVFLTAGAGATSGNYNGSIYIQMGQGSALPGVNTGTVYIFGKDVIDVTAEQNFVNFGPFEMGVASGTTITNQRSYQFLATTINGVAGGGAETVTNAATVYIDAAPSGSDITITNAYSLWVDAGLARFDGNGTNVFELPANATDPTGGGGAAVGRIPIRVGGATKYLAYY